MTQQLIATQTRAGAFDTVAHADQAIRSLLAAGFTTDQLAVICPAQFKEHFRPEAGHTEIPTSEPGGTIAMGGALGATLGGLVLAASVLGGGPIGVIGGAVLIGGGAIAGGFSNLIVSKGYEDEADDWYKRAIQHGQIVVGVEVQGDDSARHLAEAQRILNKAGAKHICPAAADS